MRPRQSPRQLLDCLQGTTKTNPSLDLHRALETWQSEWARLWDRSTLRRHGRPPLPRRPRLERGRSTAILSPICAPWNTQQATTWCREHLATMPGNRCLPRAIVKRVEYFRCAYASLSPSWSLPGDEFLSRAESVASPWPLRCHVGCRTPLAVR